MPIPNFTVGAICVLRNPATTTIWYMCGFEWRALARSFSICGCLFSRPVPGVCQNSAPCGTLSGKATELSLRSLTSLSPTDADRTGQAIHGGAVNDSLVTPALISGDLH